jgi:hypothetical protein
MEGAGRMNCLAIVRWGCECAENVLGGAPRFRGIDSLSLLLTEVLHLLAVLAVHVCDICFEHLRRCGYGC